MSMSFQICIFFIFIIFKHFMRKLYEFVKSLSLQILKGELVKPGQFKLSNISSIKVVPDFGKPIHQTKLCLR